MERLVEAKLEDFEIVCTTTLYSPGNLPLLLSPIYQRTEDPELYTIKEEPSGNKTWIRILGIDLGDRLGPNHYDVRWFPHPIPALPHHVLIQLAPNCDPIYIPKSDLHNVLLEFAEKHVDIAAQLLLGVSNPFNFDKFNFDKEKKQEYRLEAARHVAYATRAVPSDPLYLLLVCIIGQGVFAPTAMKYMIRDLSMIPKVELDKAIKRLEGKGPLQALVLEEWGTLGFGPYNGGAE